MSKLTIERFKKLSPKEQEVKYKYLSDQDKHIARITSPIAVKEVKDTRSEALKKLIAEEYLKFDNGEIDLVDMELLEKKQKN